MRHRFLIALVFTVSFGFSAALSAEEIKHTKDSLKTVKKHLKEKKAILVDVREQREWDAGHLQLAKLMPLSQIKKGIDKKSLPKDKIIYCHCRSGGRVLLAAPILKRHGYDVRPLKAGYAALLKAGFEKAKEEEKK